MSDDTKEYIIDPADAGPPKRSAPFKSDIQFPYAHLEDAVNIARIISENGSSLSKDQIAGVLSVSTSGTFNLRVSAARMFGLIEAAADNKFQLTDLGAMILSSDEAESRQAKRDAFLAIELYQKTYETFRGRALPLRPHGLEATFVNFGVAPKQKDKARLAFERSALFAGFFHAGREKLVEPIISGNGGTKAVPVVAPVLPPAAPVKETPLDAANQLLIKGLLERLPTPETAWPLAERARWLRALAVNLAMIYGRHDVGEISITAPPPPAPVATAPQHPPPPAKASRPAPAAGGPSWEPAGGDLDDEIPF